MRTTLDIKSSIHETDDFWAVAEVHARTDFPDCRRRCAIRTGTGSVMLIPTGPDGIRTYTLLSRDEVADLQASKYEGKGANLGTNHTVIGIINKRIETIMKPYKIEITKVNWVSMYHIAQRVANSFCDTAERVFILGDACHTHSPKAGQGMYTSPPDPYCSMTERSSPNRHECQHERRLQPHLETLLNPA